MAANRSTAVMQRRVEAHDSLDDFPTPPWATRALCERLFACRLKTCREPSANRGHMVKPLLEYFSVVEAFDIHDYGVGFPVLDYLFHALPMVDWTITNPPFRLAEQFIIKAMDESREGVAVIVRTAFLEGQSRYHNLFKKYSPNQVLQFTERVVMQKGKLSENGSSATAYCWIIWRKGDGRQVSLDWIAPCRKRLEKTSDYEVVA